MSCPILASWKSRSLTSSSLIPKLLELGVNELSDISELEVKDLEGIGMNKVQARKLLKSAKASGEQVPDSGAAAVSQMKGTRGGSRVEETRPSDVPAELAGAAKGF